ncbi:helix-turn-helix domain-containing protein [Streptomyces sp. NPDC101219]|uniref:transcriptional regulator n=1 Tax=Streptomyces sp. NPDC101219 TaxID=3366131 RepID=UPI0038107DC9
MSEQDEVARFAALLRELKERTDRSYGSLARRLGMNTSTLHRYCAGDAVPVDFAPLERFAALCGAKREERLELHHRWLLAAEARRRPRTDHVPQEAPPGTEPATGTSGTSRASGPAEHAAATRADPDPAEAARPARETPHPAPGGEATDGASGRSPGPGPTDGAPGTREPDPADPAPCAAAHAPGAAAPVPESADGAQDSGAPGSADGAQDARTPGPAATAQDSRTPGPTPTTRTAPPPPAPDPSAGEPALVSGPRRAGAPRPGARPWYRRKRVAVVGAVACAVLTTVGTLAALPDGRRASADEDRSGGTATASAAPTAPHRRAAPSASPSAPASPSAEADGTASSSPGAGRGSSPTATGPARPTAPAGTPLTWTANDQAWAHGCGHDYVVDAPPERVPPPPAPQDAGVWAGAQRAVHGGETLVELSVQGTSDTAVVLTALRVRVVGRGAPAAGHVYAMDQGCGGALTPRYFDVDLDKDRPLARPVAGNDAGTPLPAVRMPYRVSAEDPEVLLVTARTDACDCRWYLELDWSSQGRTGTVRVDDGGRPFRTSGIAGLPHYEYDTSGRRWARRSG